jgi:hypothetical protein
MFFENASNSDLISIIVELLDIDTVQNLDKVFKSKLKLKIDFRRLLIEIAEDVEKISEKQYVAKCCAGYIHTESIVFKSSMLNLFKEVSLRIGDPKMYEYLVCTRVSNYDEYDVEADYLYGKKNWSETLMCSMLFHEIPSIFAGLRTYSRKHPDLIYRKIDPNIKQTDNYVYKRKYSKQLIDDFTPTSSKYNIEINNVNLRLLFEFHSMIKSMDKLVYNINNNNNNESNEKRKRKIDQTNIINDKDDDDHNHQVKCVKNKNNNNDNANIDTTSNIICDEEIRMWGSLTEYTKLGCPNLKNAEWEESVQVKSSIQSR